VVFSLDSEVLATCGDRDPIRLRDGITGEVIRTLPSPAPGYTTVAFTPDGRRVLATGQDGAVYTWDNGGGSWGRFCGFRTAS